MSLKEAVKFEMPHAAKYMFLHYVKTGRFNDALYGGVAQKGHITFVALFEKQCLKTVLSNGIAFLYGQL